MTTLETIDRKISEIQKYLIEAKNFKEYGFEELKDNIKDYRSLERSLFLSVQATIDLADMCVSLKKLRKPTSLSESFDILQEQKIIPVDLTHKLVSMTGFRNVLTHGYTEVNPKRVYEILHDGLRDIEEFIEIVGKL